MSAHSGVPAPVPRRRRRAWLLLLLVSLLLVPLALVWLLGSGGGRDFALARVLAALPPGSLSWREAEGTLAGPLQLRGVRFEHEGMRVEVERVLLDFAPRALIGRTLQIERLELEQGRVLLPPGDDDPEPWPRRIELPSSLPQLRLPLTVALDALAVRDVSVRQQELSLIDIARLDLTGRFEAGRITLQRLELDSDRVQLQADGALDSARRWDTGLRVSLQLPGREQAPPLPLRLDMQGDLRDFVLTAHAALPEPATLSLRITGGLPAPAWTLALHAPRVDAVHVGLEGDPLAVQVQADGDLSALNLSGRVARGAQNLVIERSTLRYDDGVLTLQPLALVLDEGRVQAAGDIDLRPADPVLALQLDWRALRWAPAGAANEAVSSAGNARVEGTLAAYTVVLDAALQRAQQQAQLQLRGAGDRRELRIAQVHLGARQGELDASGRIAWEPQPAWVLEARLRRFDPAWLVPDFPGAVDAVLASEGMLTDAGPQGTVRIDSLGGSLRGRALAGEASASLAADASGRGRVDLRIGTSRLRGEGGWGRALDASLQLAPLHLSDLLPDAAGTLEGRVHASGLRDAPDLRVQLQGQALAFDGITAQRMQLDADLQALERGHASVVADSVEIAGQPLSQLRLDVAGSRAQHQLQLQAASPMAALSLQLDGGEHAAGWRGTLQSLRIAPEQHEPWRLREPAPLEFERATTRVVARELCLHAPPASSLCVDADWGAQAGTLSLQLDTLPLATLDPWLGEMLQMPASAYGEVSAEGRLERRGGQMQGRFELRSAEGGLRLDPDAPRDLLVFRDLALDAELTPERALLQARARLADDGTLQAELEALDPTQRDGALDGQLQVRLSDLGFITLFTGEVATPVGALEADLTLAGTRATPSLQGSARLRDFAAELPALGLKLHDGSLQLRSEGASAARVEGSIVSGEGTLRVEGEFDAAADAERRLRVSVKGERVTAMDTPDISALVSPDLELTLAGSRLRLRGDVAVPRARIDLEQLESATTPSADVIIVDAESTDDSAAIELDSDVGVVLGEDVRLNGFGLDGKLAGRISVRDRPGRATLARGGIEVSGEYKAYGQDLRITRGRLAYASTPIDNPALDIRAEREVDEVTVGVQVRGTVLAPELTLWSEPALDQAEQLSYLVLGRPLRSASQADGAQLSQAAAAFGGNLLAQRLGARMGLDEVGVADSRALGGAALTVGKYLSPRLYVSYGVALFGSGQVVTFKYLLSRVWSVQIDSGTENRAALNYRLER